MTNKSRLMVNNVRCSGRRKIRQPQTSPTNSKRPPTQVQPLANRSTSLNVKIQPGADCSSGGRLGKRSEGYSGGGDWVAGFAEGDVAANRGGIVCRNGVCTSMAFSRYGRRTCIPLAEFHQST